MFLNVFQTIYNSFPMSCKGILRKQNSYCSNFEFELLIAFVYTGLNAQKLYMNGWMAGWVWKSQ